MKAGVELLKPKLVEAAVEPIGKIVIGTVKGDLHDIGKNLVAMMLEGVGFEIIDLGTDVAPEAFLAAINEHQPHLIGMSALLTTTMPAMGATVKTLQDAGVRDKVRIMVGGAPITQAYADEIGADIFAQDGAAAAREAKAAMTK
jgi:5-methyltetrahydrofolate--homocysteine methyltransferase